MSENTKEMRELANIRKNESIKIWRILSCLGVLTVHLGQRLHLEGNMRAFTDFGQYGVYLFFIISGYLACFSRELREGDVLGYWYKRAARLLPLYYFVIAVYFACETWLFQTVPEDSTGLGWLRYFLLLFGFVDSKQKFWVNLGFTWTIPVFCVFYCLAPFIIKTVKNYWQSWAAIAFFSIQSYVLKIEGGGNLSACTYLQFFVYGIMLYYCEKENKERETVFVLSVFLIGFSVFFDPVNRMIDYYANIYAAIMVLLLVSTQEISVTNEKLRLLIDKLDQCSYTIYLVQGIVFEEIIIRYQFFLSPWQIVLIATIGTGILAYVVYHLYERPIYRVLKRKKKKSGISH